MVQYEPGKFTGLLMRRIHPVKSHCQMYSNGKITVNGGTSVKASKYLARMYCKALVKLGFSKVVLSHYKIVNMVGTASLGHSVNIPDIAKSLSLFYSPETFLGLTIKLSESTAVIFHTGKINFLGAKSELAMEASLIELKILI
jgi:TATA-box binding protein (TBP) (component of TFIID and TFIIIB)